MHFPATSSPKDSASAAPSGAPAPDGQSGTEAAAGAGLFDPYAQDAMIGRHVTHYRVEERLGQGGMGVVYRATDLTLGRPVALKFLPPHLSTDEAAQARFVHEARAASALDHANVGVLHEIARAEDGSLFIVMAFYAGETLKSRIERGPLPLDAALDYGFQVACGLKRAHEAGIVHRDIKPANVIVTEDGVAKILDFGLAKIQDVSLTQVGGTLGTALYMSPEQARGEAVDHRTDLWSLGAMLYEMLAGRPPFRGDYEPAVLYSILHEEPVPLSDLVPGIPDRVAEIVRCCLQKDPSQRYEDAATLVEDLRPFQPGAELGPQRAARLAPPSAWKHAMLRHRLALSLGLAAVVGIIAAALFLLRPDVQSKRYLAVLPFQIIGPTEEAEAFSVGLHESLTSKLTQLERFQEALWVVPASETRESMTPSEARDRFGATMVVTGTVQFEGTRARLTLNLIDTETRSQIGSEQLDHQSTSALALQDASILMLARMLQVNLRPEAREVITAGSTADGQANALYLRGYGHLRQQQSVEEIDRAIALFETALEEDPRFALAEAGLGDAYWHKYIRTKDVQWAEAAVQHSERALTLDDGLAPVHITLGIIHSGRQQYDRALQAYGRALELEPLNEEVYRRRAALYASRGQTAEAEADYRHAIVLKPDYWRGYNSLALFYYRSGRYDEAVAQYTQALKLAPGNVSLLTNMAAAYWEMLRLDDAIRTFERVLALDSTHASATANLATAYFYQGRFPDAARLYARELARTPHDYSMQGYLADALYWIPERRAEARDGFRRAIELARRHLAVSERDPDLLGSLTAYHARLGEADSARHYLQRLEMALSSGQVNGNQAFGLGEVYLQLGEREEALTWMDRALAQGVGWDRVLYSPWLKDLRDTPAFQRMIASHPRPDERHATP